MINSCFLRGAGSWLCVCMGGRPLASLGSTSWRDRPSAVGGGTPGVVPPIATSGATAQCHPRRRHVARTSRRRATLDSHLGRWTQRLILRRIDREEIIQIAAN